MADHARRRPILGSEPRDVADSGSRDHADSRPQSPDIIEVTVELRPNPDVIPIDVILAQQAALPVHERTYLTPADMEKRGPVQEDIDLLVAFAADNGLEFVRVEPALAGVVLRGDPEAVARAFGAQVQRTAGGIAPSGTLSVPEALGGIVRGVIGIDTRPVASTNPPTSPRRSGPPHGLA